jgi:hypothetical protein
MRVADRLRKMITISETLLRKHNRAAKILCGFTLADSCFAGRNLAKMKRMAKYSSQVFFQTQCDTCQEYQCNDKSMDYSGFLVILSENYGKKSRQCDDKPRIFWNLWLNLRKN